MKSQIDIHFFAVITCSFQLAFDGFLNSIKKYLSVIEDNMQREKAGFWNDFKLRKNIFLFI